MGILIVNTVVRADKGKDGFCHDPYLITRSNRWSVDVISSLMDFSVTACYPMVLTDSQSAVFVSMDFAVVVEVFGQRVLASTPVEFVGGLRVNAVGHHTSGLCIPFVRDPGGVRFGELDSLPSCPKFDPFIPYRLIGLNRLTKRNRLSILLIGKTLYVRTYNQRTSIIAVAEQGDAALGCFPSWRQRPVIIGHPIEDLTSDSIGPLGSRRSLRV